MCKGLWNSIAGFAGVRTRATPRPTAYQELEGDVDRGGRLGEAVRDKEAIGMGTYGCARLIGIRTETIADRKGVSREQATEWLRRAVMGAGSRADGYLLLSWDEAGKDALVELAITEMSPGSRMGRIMAGELGSGHAWVQVEGRVTDAESKRLLMAFRDRRRSSGAMGARDLGGDTGPQLMRELIGAIGADIRAEIAQFFNLAVCPRCSSDVPEGSAFCPACGEKHRQ